MSHECSILSSMDDCLELFGIPSQLDVHVVYVHVVLLLHNYRSAKADKIKDIWGLFNLLSSIDCICVFNPSKPYL